MSLIHAYERSGSLLVLSQMVDEARDVNAHITLRNGLQSRKTCFQ